MTPDEVAVPLLCRLVGPLPLSLCSRTVFHGSSRYPQLAQTAES